MDRHKSLHRVSNLMGFTMDITVRSEISVALYEETIALILMETKASARILTSKSYSKPYDSKLQNNSVSIMLTDNTEYNDIADEGEIMLSLNADTETKKQLTFKNVCFLPSLKHTGISVKSRIQQGHAYTVNADRKCVLIDEVKCPRSSKDDND